MSSASHRAETSFTSFSRAFRASSSAFSFSSVKEPWFRASRAAFRSKDRNAS